MRIIAFVLDPPVIERILTHIGEPTTAPIVLPARSPPQSEMAFQNPRAPSEEGGLVQRSPDVQCPTKQTGLPEIAHMPTPLFHHR